jgi:hypothetical protein
MRAKSIGLCHAILLVAGAAAAQLTSTAAPPGSGATQAQAQAARSPDYSSIYCAGFYTDQKVPDDTYLISGEQSNAKIVFAQGDYVYLNKGSNNGIRAGDEFSVVRPVKDPLTVSWFKWQKSLTGAMGTLYEDEGRLRVVNVHPKVSIAEVIFSCMYIQRGDIVRPFQERPAPPFKEAAAFDSFAPVNGKPIAMVVTAKDFAQESGAGSIVYVNLGTEKGVKVGDYFRVFRYQGSRNETVYQTPGFQDRLYGFGSTPERYSWNDLPREVLGEGIVLNASRSSSTVLLTYSRREIYAGDYVELE